MNTITICVITFIITLIIFVISLKFNTLKDIPMYAKIILLFCSSVPTWGFVIVIAGIILTIRDLYYRHKK
jgi:hypothetical protein